MGKKLTKCQNSDGEDLEGVLRFFCPGCEQSHKIQVAPYKGITWEFNGDFEKPTFSPSYLLNKGGIPERICHSFIKDGNIQFLGDCFHKLKGKTVELPDWDDNKSLF